MSDTALAIVANIIAIASLLAVLRTLHEMRLQRKSTYAPDIFVGDATAHVAWSWSSPLHVRISGEPITDNDAVDLSGRLPPPHIPCSNLGVGVAKRVACEWRFEPRAFVHIVNTYIAEQAVLETDRHIIRIVTRTGRESRSETLLWLDDIIHVPFIVPSTGAADNATLIPAPREYLYLTAAVVACLGDGVFSAITKLPALSLHVSYEDRDGTLHKRVHVFEPSASLPSSRISEDVGIGGMVTIKSISETKPQAG